MKLYIHEWHEPRQSRRVPLNHMNTKYKTTVDIEIHTTVSKNLKITEESLLVSGYGSNSLVVYSWMK